MVVLWRAGPGLRPTGGNPGITAPTERERVPTSALGEYDAESLIWEGLILP